jgi:hypothetical protein
VLSRDQDNNLTLESICNSTLSPINLCAGTSSQLPPVLFAAILKKSATFSSITNRSSQTINRPNTIIQQKTKPTRCSLARV